MLKNTSKRRSSSTGYISQRGPITTKEIVRETVKGLPSAAKTVIGAPFKAVGKAIGSAAQGLGTERRKPPFWPSEDTRKKINEANKKTLEQLKKKK